MLLEMTEELALSAGDSFSGIQDLKSQEGCTKFPERTLNRPVSVQQDSVLYKVADVGTFQ